MKKTVEQWLGKISIINCFSISSVSCFLVFLAGAMFLLTDPAWLLMRDGQAAVNVSHRVMTLEYWLDPQPVNVDLGEILSLPFYPLFLKISDLILGPLEGALLHSHLLIGVLCGGLLCYVLRKIVHPAYSAFAQIVSWLMAEPIFRAAMPEWLAFCLISLVFVLAFIFFAIHQQLSLSKAEDDQRSSKVRAIALLLGVLFSILVLTKSAFAVSALLVVLIISVESWHQQGKMCLYGFLLPLAIWMGLNLNRVGSLTVMPGTEVAIFGMISQFSHADIHEDDDTDLRNFITYVNERKVPSPEGERGWIEQIGENYSSGFNATNIWLVAEQYRRDQLIASGEFLRLIRSYYVRALSAHLSRWVQYFQEGLFNSLITIIMGIISLLLLMRKARILPDKLLPLVRAASLIILLHILTISFEAATNGWSPRYEMMTGSQVWFIALLTAWIIYSVKDAKSSN